MSFSKYLSSNSIAHLGLIRIQHLSVQKCSYDLLESYIVALEIAVYYSIPSYLTDDCCNLNRIVKQTISLGQYIAYYKN